MDKYSRDLIPHMEAIYDRFTSVEKVIADYFLKNPKREDYSAKSVAKDLAVSEASLSRFAKKCGYRGYRELIFHFQSQNEGRVSLELNDHMAMVFSNYQELLNKSDALLKPDQIQHLVQLFNQKKKISVYGKGSSGLAAQEMKFRFMRIGVNMEAITDGDIMRMDAVLMDQESLAIGISVSGKTKSVIRSLEDAKKRGAKTVLMTAHLEENYKKFCDEILLFAVKEHLEQGMAISPQFPILVMVDLLYSQMLLSDRSRRTLLHQSTVKALEQSKKS
ncbi:MAG: MurR/RpiR family transcriptional regulator [Tissierellia bacterium]|nr:MurR/RpiR family transcriptional regulator [Tissierellia bacterium]